MSKQFLLDNIKNAYFVGIGGVSMSSLAIVLKNRGVTVAGYDMKQSQTTRMLEDLGIKIDYEHNLENLSCCDTVIYTAAVSTETAPELSYAQDNNLLLLSRAELLGAVTASYKYSVGVSGTHGKSTTTGMIASIYMEFDKESSVLSGCVIPSLGATYKIGTSDRMVFEACEYKDSFLSMCPSLKLVLNCKLDHVDYFKDIEAVKNSFTKYMDIPHLCGENMALVNLDCENATAAAKKSATKVYYYSTNEKCDFYAKNIRIINGCGIFDLYTQNDLVISDIKLSVPGMHNISNAVAAAASSLLTGVSEDAVKKGLESFTGVARRFEKKGEYNGAVLIDDYAHHPDEIEVTLNTAKTLNKNRIICVFQPHTYSRTKSLLHDFAKALSIADKIYLLEIFPAREENIYGISSNDLADIMKKPCKVADFDEIAEMLKKEINENDLVITMGAGEAYKVADILLNNK
ncbi:MAG: UDP-N-acetylmuramate--L-alanine ligase [Ruminococcaceae bacterium]|nr:UDP-N-acetylmuramate--L-alanine ligase [Oscillospiraceae bacterium]